MFIYLRGVILIFSGLFSFSVQSTVNMSFEKHDYEILSFSSIEPNQYRFNEDSLKIYVDQSASPLIYQINNPQVFEKLRFNARKTGSLNLKEYSTGEERKR